MNAIQSKSEPPPCLCCGATNPESWAQASDVEYFTSDDSFSYLRCGACGVLYIDPVPLTRLAEIYPSNYYSFAEPQHSFATKVKDALDARHWRKLLGNLPGDSLRLLDI